MAELLCQGVAKSYGRTQVLADVDLVVPSGTLTAILGASGSGKTTLLRLVMGFTAVDGGRIAVDGRAVAEAGRVHVAPDKRAIGYVAQEGALFPHLTAGENVGFGLPRSERRGSRVLQLLELVGLDGSYASRHPHQLSGGEQRRVALARALAPRPRLVLLDEPFSGLDAGLRAETREAVLRALAGEGTTAVLVTHDQAEALSTGREVAVLRSGLLVQTATPTELYRTPVDLDVARFVGDAVVLSGHVRAGLVDCALGDGLAVRRPVPDGIVEVMVRPEQIRLLPPDAPDVGASAAEVVDRSYRGSETMVAVVLADEARTPIAVRTLDEHLPAVGETVRLAVAGAVVAYPAEGAADGALSGEQPRGSWVAA